MSDNVQLAQELVDARAAVASAEYSDRARRIADIEAEATQLKGINAAADARLQRAAVAVSDIGNEAAYQAGYAAAVAAIEAAKAAEAEAAAAASAAAAVEVEAAPEAPPVDEAEYQVVVG